MIDHLPPGDGGSSCSATATRHRRSWTKKEGHFPGITYPRVPGHEIAGVIDAIGSEGPRWTVGQYVGVGWLGSYCGHCDSCRRGSFITCANQLVTGITMDGGYQDHVLAPFEGLALIPDDSSPVDAGPLMCAGIPTFNSLRNSGARGGDTVAVLGIGGLGHLAVQFASKTGFHTIAIARHLQGAIGEATRCPPLP